MPRFHNVELEIVRPGPPHNQLLSPLTLYLALCGEGSPITFHIDLEHHKLVSRLQQLRYVAREARGVAMVPNAMREAAVLELAEVLGRVLADIRTLLAEVWRARCDTGEGEELQLVHLRLVLGGSELALIPFEMALAPPAMPGEGLEFCLQLGMPVVLTRELRSSRLGPISWNRGEPKVLIVAAAPGGLDIPLEPHIHALRAALEPWIRWPKPAAPDPEQARLPCVKERLRVLTDASIEDIYDLCAQESFTHVHVLAHGAPYELAGEQRFGLALCEKGNPSQVDVVSGKRLGKALQAESADGARRSQPLVVTLATCDSGNPGSILVPGGSIAHDLHSAGIPCVFASQFPLTKIGSVRMAEALYPRLLRGDDPRQVIYEVRRLLYMSAQRDHDWASLVVYASIPDHLQVEVADFFERQAHSAIDIGLGRADDAKEAANLLDSAAMLREVQEGLRQAEGYLEVWEARLPLGSDMGDRTRRSECYGMQGSTYKRIAVLLDTLAQNEQKAQDEIRKTAEAGAAEADAGGSPATAPAADVAQAKIDAHHDKAVDYYRKALERYRKAMDEIVLEGGKYHWTATQALCVAALLNEPRDPTTLHSAREIASQNLRQPTPGNQAWAHGTLAELELLSLYHEKEPMSAAEVEKKVVDHCKEIVRLMGPQSFHATSTYRQFRRYLHDWKRDEWKEVAQAAVAALSQPGASDV
ncbi:MAG TPA: CHAT domain-containing protein [Candidatus Dormibacteraeota bacterium]|nr:CHAT domain-containing protein [Candidatus Dormibacteraeota bacterium]